MRVLPRGPVPDRGGSGDPAQDLRPGDRVIDLDAELMVGVEPDLVLDLTLELVEQPPAPLTAAERELLARELAAAGNPGGPASDEALAARAREGDAAALHALLLRYRVFARIKARSYFLVGADRDDILQEAMIGLYKAIRDFNPTMQTSFRVFAELCVTRQIITAIKAATRQKHGPLNSYISFHRPVACDDDGDRVLADMLPTMTSSDPADLVISAERIRGLQRHVDEVLSDLEAEVLRLYVDGKSYQEIAARLHRQVKSIDNALQRIKRKLEEHLREPRDTDSR